MAKDNSRLVREEIVVAQHHCRGKRQVAASHPRLSVLQQVVSTAATQRGEAQPKYHRQLGVETLLA